MNILIIVPGFIPSTIIGVLRPLSELERQGEVLLRLRFSNIDIRKSQDIEWCDIAVFCRNCEVKDLSTLYELKRREKKIIYEIDDNFEEIPLTTDIGIYHRAFYRLHVLKRFFAFSDITRVYSDRMLQRSKKHGACVQLIKSYFDKSIVDGLKRSKSSDVIRIVYPTGRVDEDELEEKVFSAVGTILEKYDGKVEFHLWRKLIPRQLTNVRGVVLNKGIRGYDNFIRSFFKAGFDIGLAPGIDTPFFHSKTNNKYREFGGCSIAGIYSNFLPYTNSVTHEHTGLLVGNSKEEWVAAIERLIDDVKLRAELVKNAADDIFQNYSFESAVESWRDSLHLLNGHNSELPKWLPTAKQHPSFTYIALSPEDRQLNQRYRYLRTAVSVIPNSIMEDLSAEQYVKSPHKLDFSACIVFLSCEKELKVISTLLPLSSSFIIDMSAYEDDVDSAIRYLHKVASNTPMSFLASSEQTRKSALIENTQNCVLLDEISPIAFEQLFSLSGYPAAYLELVERHIHFAPERVKSFYHARLGAVPYMIANQYKRWKRRFGTVLMLIKWRLGFRRF